jgi:hypothetical protein
LFPSSSASTCTMPSRSTRLRSSVEGGREIRDIVRALAERRNVKLDHVSVARQIARLRKLFRRQSSS